MNPRDSDHSTNRGSSAIYGSEPGEASPCAPPDNVLRTQYAGRVSPVPQKRAPVLLPPRASVDSWDQTQLAPLALRAAKQTSCMIVAANASNDTQQMQPNEQQSSSSKLSHADQDAVAGPAVIDLNGRRASQSNRGGELVAQP